MTTSNIPYLAPVSRLFFNITIFWFLSIITHRCRTITVQTIIWAKFHFLFRSPNRKWQHFCASYWLIHAVFLERVFLGCRIQWSCPKCCHFVFRSPKRTPQHFPAVYWWWHWNTNDTKSLKRLELGTTYMYNNHHSIQSDFIQLLYACAHKYSHQ